MSVAEGLDDAAPFSRHGVLDDTFVPAQQVEPLLIPETHCRMVPHTTCAMEPYTVTCCVKRYVPVCVPTCNPCP